MIKFIESFKNTSYYQRIFDNAEVLLMYLAGSRCVGITDERSDYDITVITLDGDYIDSSSYEYLMYKGKKVHWYYRPLKHLLKTDHNNSMTYIGTMLLKNIRDDLIIYKNPKYKDKLDRLCAAKDILSELGMRRLFDVQKSYIDDVINEGRVLEKHHTKYLYHLCLVSYYLMGEELDKDFLRVLKRIKWQPVSDDYKQLAVERLVICKNYIKTHPINIEADLQDLYKEMILNE